MRLVKFLLATGARNTTISGVIVIATMASAASASPITEYFAGFAAPDTRQSVRHFAACIAKRYPADVQASLRADLGTSQILSRYPQLMNTACAPRAVFKFKNTRITDGLYQSDLAETMLRLDYNGGDLPVLSDVPPLPKDEVPNVDNGRTSERMQTAFAVMRESAVLDVVGECVARAASGAVYRLVVSAPDSDDERSQFSALTPFFDPCVAGRTVATVPLFAWRAVLATRLYRLVDAARPASHEGATPHA